MENISWESLNQNIYITENSKEVKLIIEIFMNVTEIRKRNKPIFKP